MANGQAARLGEVRLRVRERLRLGGEGEAGGRAGTYFIPYQKRWILDPAPLLICEKGRQTGLSYAHAYKIVRRAAQKGARDEWVMSRDEIQSRQFILYCKRWANVLKYAAEDHGEQVYSVGDGVRVQVLRFASGACIYAVSSSPDVMVGKTGNVTLDEFALHRDQRQLYAVAKPVTTWGGCLAIISTHRGAGTVFNRLILDIKERGNPMGWSLHTVPIQQAVEEGLVEKIDGATAGEWTKRWENTKHQTPSSTETASSNPQVATLREYWLAQLRAECIDEEQWLQEYCCVAADEASAFITYEMITECEDGELRLVGAEELDGENRTDKTYYLGVDVARKKDLCVLDLGEKIGDVMWDRQRIELQGKTFSEIKYELYQLLRMRALKRCCIDASGLGMQLAEEAHADFGWKVEPITFTSQVKQELAFGLRTDFEERRLRLVRDDKLRADLRGIKKEVGLGGNIRFVGESADSHCDRFWAKALRQYAARDRDGIGAAVA